MKGSFTKKKPKKTATFNLTKKVILCNWLITYGSEGYEHASKHWTVYLLVCDKPKYGTVHVNEIESNFIFRIFC